MSTPGVHQRGNRGRCSACAMHNRQVIARRPRTSTRGSIFWTIATNTTGIRRTRPVKGSCLFWAVMAVLMFPVSLAYKLNVKSCNLSWAGTKDTVLMSFCEGYSNCTMGPPNAYNSRGELGVPGAWNEFEVPLDYKPTTLAVSISDSDAWCIEDVVWEDQGGSLMGRGARVSLDADIGIEGCQFGVHQDDAGLLFPCKTSWRFFNLQREVDYMYDIALKTCQGWPRSRLLASFCAESTCSDDIGDVVQHNLTMTSPKKTGWQTKQVHVGFNPVALKLTSFGDAWCLEDIVFNGYRLVPTTAPPVRLVHAGDQRIFFNVQFLGAAPYDSGGNPGEFLANVLHIAFEVLMAVTAGLVYTATIKGTAFVYRRYSRGLSKGGTPGSEKEGKTGVLLCAECTARMADSSSANANSTSDNENETLLGGIHSGTTGGKALPHGTVAELDEDRSDRTALLGWTNSRETPRRSRGRLGSRITDRILGLSRIETLRDASTATEEQGWIRGGDTEEPLRRPALHRWHSGGASSYNSSRKGLHSAEYKDEDNLNASSPLSILRPPRCPPSPV